MLIKQSILGIKKGRCNLKRLFSGAVSGSSAGSQLAAIRVCPWPCSHACTSPVVSLHSAGRPPWAESTQCSAACWEKQSLQGDSMLFCHSWVGDVIAMGDGVWLSGLGSMPVNGRSPVQLRCSAQQSGCRWPSEQDPPPPPQHKKCYWGVLDPNLYSGSSAYHSTESVMGYAKINILMHLYKRQIKHHSILSSQSWRCHSVVLLKWSAECHIPSAQMTQPFTPQVLIVAHISAAVAVIVVIAIFPTVTFTSRHDSIHKLNGYVFANWCLRRWSQWCSFSFI